MCHPANIDAVDLLHIDHGSGSALAPQCRRDSGPRWLRWPVEDERGGVSLRGRYPFPAAAGVSALLNYSILTAAGWLSCCSGRRIFTVG